MHRERFSRWSAVDQLAHLGHDLFMGDIPCNGHNRVARGILLEVVVDELLARDSANGLARAADVAPHGLVRPQRLVDEQVGECVGVVVGHRELFEDDPPLTLDLLRREQRMTVHVGQHVERDVEVVARDLGVVDRRLAVGACVEHPADGLDGARNQLRLGALLTAFEEHVLQEVGRARYGVILVARPRAHEDAR